MKNSPLILTLVVLAVGSCTENKPAQQAQPARNPFLQNLQQGQVTYSSNVAQPGQPAATAAPIGGQPLSLQNMAVTPTAAPPKPAEPAIQIPPDARWTLLITSLNTPDRFATMQRLKATLAARTPFKNWYVVHGETESTLFHGFYTSIERNERDPALAKAAARAQAEREAIKNWQDESGARPFASAFFTAITAPDPVAPAEWNLTNAPAGTFWSVQVGAYQGDPRRKQFAVDAVREARAKGIPAYYYHGATISSVCIGAWPPKSVKEQEQVTGETDPERALLVTNMPLPDRFKYLDKNRTTDRDGQKLDILAQRLDIDDPTLAATLKQYPDHYVNGDRTKRKVAGADGKEKVLYSPSFLVIIPREEATIFNNNNTMFGGSKGAGAAEAPTGVNPYGQSAPAGAGKLRGLK
jgi:hypothetical protein